MACIYFYFLFSASTQENKNNNSFLNTREEADSNLSLSKDQILKFIADKHWQGNIPKEQESNAIRTAKIYYSLPSSNAEISVDLVNKILADPEYKIPKYIPLAALGIGLNLEYKN